INSIPVAINQDMKALVPRIFIEPYYLLFHLISMSSDLLKAVKGTTADNLSTYTLKELTVMIPPREVQLRFSEMAMQVMGTVKTQEIASEKIDMIFSTLLHKAFRGEIHTNPLEAPSSLPYPA